MELIGLTGGIASGKSTVARMLRAARIDVIDADALAREVVAPGSEGLRRVVERFGEEMLDEQGALDRRRLGDLVFHNEAARHDLNRIVHPLVAQAAAERIQALTAEGKERVVYEVPLLFENRLDEAMTATLLIYVPEEVQLRRLMARDDLDEEAALARIRAQMPIEEKRRRATYVIDNSASLADTARQLLDVWERISGRRIPFASPA